MNEIITAISIDTELWNRVIRLLINDHWTVTHKYDNFDAGIDFDFVILAKDKEEILFGWDNWFAGEIQCLISRMNVIEHMANCKFEKGNPENLTPEVIALNRKQKAGV